MVNEIATNKRCKDKSHQHRVQPVMAVASFVVRVCVCRSAPSLSLLPSFAASSALSLSFDPRALGTLLRPIYVHIAPHLLPDCRVRCCVGNGQSAPHGLLLRSFLRWPFRSFLPKRASVLLNPRQIHAQTHRHCVPSCAGLAAPASSGCTLYYSVLSIFVWLSRFS